MLRNKETVKKTRTAEAEGAQQGESTLVEKVIELFRCAKVVKGGRRFSFAALVVCGDQNGSIGVGYGKANEVPDAIRKATERARKKLIKIQLKGLTIPHEVIGRAGAGIVVMKPASPGTGIIAGGGARLVLEVLGIKDILTKSLKSKNKKSVVNATINGLLKLRSSEQIRSLRNIHARAEAN